jgi:hypothetical protein
MTSRRCWLIQPASDQKDPKRMPERNHGRRHQSRGTASSRPTQPQVADSGRAVSAASIELLDTTGSPEGVTTDMCAGRPRTMFNGSRSSWRARFSLRRRANSSRSPVVRPVLPLVRSARACSTPVAERGLRQAQVARGGGHGLALVEHQPDGTRLEVVSEAAPSPPRLRVRHG